MEARPGDACHIGDVAEAPAEVPELPEGSDPIAGCFLHLSLGSQCPGGRLFVAPERPLLVHRCGV